MGSPYVKKPEPSDEVKPLYLAVLRVLSGESSETEAASSVGLSRVRFQTRLHRGLHGLMQALEDLTPGRKAKSEREQELEAEVARLQRENASLTAQVQRTARMMGLASEWMRKGLAATPRARRSKPTTEAPVKGSDDDGPAALLAQAEALRETGVGASLASAAIGRSAATVRRWSHRAKTGKALVLPRGPRAGVAVDEVARTKVDALVRETRGCMGAEPLSHATGLSRRTVARLKAECQTAHEQQRRTDATRVTVSAGVIRGFDAMDVSGIPVLVSADASVAYRTSICVADRYDTQWVADALAQDFALNGAPLVWRVDRWKAHQTQPVLEVLEAYGVLLLHGPPRHPRYYGQLERQNREHRAWLDAKPASSKAELVRSCEQMVRAFNELVPRRRLAWRTAAEVWRARPVLAVDRAELRAEVEERSLKLKEQEALRVAYPGFVERLAIEAALIQRGLLKLQKGGWC